MREKFYIAAITAANFLGCRRVLRLMEIFGTAKNIWEVDDIELEKSGLPTSALESLLDWRKKYPDCPEMVEEFCEKRSVGLCGIFDEDYPPLLKEIQTPPVCFYYRGNLQPSAERIAIVGSRNSTNYGTRVAFNLGEELAAAGVTVVSGAARGIDPFAHRGALKTGRTVAVLGCGINKVFPPENKGLIEEIAESGLVISEFSPNTQPSVSTFPMRNRIIAGLSRGVVIVEAGEKSGALITADQAADFSRDVFAVPGNIYSESSFGCNKLIQEGANLIKNARDILEYYDVKIEPKIPERKNLFMPNDDEKPKKKFSAKKLPEKNISQPKLSDEPKKERAPLEGIFAKVFDVIPSGSYVVADEILNSVDDISIDELQAVLLKLELKDYIVEDSYRYTRAD